MPEITEAQVLDKLRNIDDPDLHKDIVTLGFIKDLKIDGGSVSFKIELTTPACPVKQVFHDQAVALVKEIDGVTDVKVEMTSRVRGGSFAPEKKLPKGVSNVIAVSSGKGGVGKSTVAANLAAGLVLEGAKVGIMDVDFYGPNIPLLMGVDAVPLKVVGDKMQPLERHGIKILSLGNMVPPGTAVVWRGPMFHKVIAQFIDDADWGEIDYLIIDFPPGTGDAQMSVCQHMPVVGGVIVTTPQDLSLADVNRAIDMFLNPAINIPILGVVENMSWFECECGKRTHIFGEGGGRKLVLDRGVDLLGQIPIDTRIRARGDEGIPVVLDDEHPQASIFREIAKKVAARISTIVHTAADK